MLMRFLLTLLACALLTACGTRRALYPFTETVLTEGTTLTARTPSGLITISAGKGTSRTYGGDGWIAEKQLIARPVRWYGSLGLYDPAASATPYGRVLAEEGKLFFETETEALRYFYVGSTFMQPVFTRDGLVVGYRISLIPGGEPVRSIQLWQVYIKSHKPRNLRGAQDGIISIRGGTIPETAPPYPAPIGHARTLGEKEYIPPRVKNR